MQPSPYATALTLLSRNIENTYAKMCVIFAWYILICIGINLMSWTKNTSLFAFNITQDNITLKKLRCNKRNFISNQSRNISFCFEKYAFWKYGFLYDECRGCTLKFATGVNLKKDIV